MARAARQEMRAARPLFARALERHPDDRQTVLLAGKALLEYGSGEEPLVLRSWRAYLQRHPGDREIAAALEAAQKRDRR